MRKKLKIKIPAGVDDGARLRVAGEGEPGVRGGGHGDLYVYIFVRRDPQFTRQGNDVVSQQTITFAQAALGCTIRVDTIDGQVSESSGRYPEWHHFPDQRPWRTLSGLQWPQR